MKSLQSILDHQCTTGLVPGAVAMASTPSQREVASSGVRELGRRPMGRDTIFRIASLTKPITAAVTMALMDRGRLSLDDEVRRWLPELAAPMVLRTPEAELDDVVPAERAITVRDLLTFTGGLGMPGDFNHPIMPELLGPLHQGPPAPQAYPSPDDWMQRVARLPLLHQPGQGWTYNTGYDILGVLLSRVQGQPLSEVFDDTILLPLGLKDTGFWYSEAAAGRVATLYRRSEDPSGYAEIDDARGQWSRPPAFASGAGGLVSTVDDWHRFARMLLANGWHQGRQVLSFHSARTMLKPHVYGQPGNRFLNGQAWGLGGAVDVAETEPWNVIGRYGWVGGLGTAGYIVPATGTVVVWLSQLAMNGPDDFSALATVLTHGAQLSRGIG